MRIVTSVSLFKTAAGQRMSITYSEINESGDITKENAKVSKIIVSEDVLSKIDTVMNEAQIIVDAIE